MRGGKMVILFSLLCCLLNLQHPVAAQLVPSLFVFGDSSVDSGNNNFLNTTAKCNHVPYGINFASRKPTGRCTDGMLITDCIASYLGLRYPPNFVEERNFTTGANFASVSAGILNTTGSVSSCALINVFWKRSLPVQGEIRTFDQQIRDFAFVKSKLDEVYGSSAASSRIARSIFYINIGSNDVAGYWRATKEKLSMDLQNQLIQQMTQNILRLYILGARRIVVVSSRPIGCPPGEKLELPCNDTAEASAKSYNTALASALNAISSARPRFYLSYANLHDIMQQVMQSPSSYGLTNATQPCCPTIGRSWCSPSDEFCRDSAGYMFWDIAHTSDAFNKLTAKRFWNGPLTDIYPLNIRQLAAMPMYK